MFSKTPKKRGGGFVLQDQNCGWRLKRASTVSVTMTHLPKLPPKGFYCQCNNDPPSQTAPWRYQKQWRSKTGPFPCLLSSSYWQMLMLHKVFWYQSAWCAVLLINLHDLLPTNNIIHSLLSICMMHSLLLIHVIYSLITVYMKHSLLLTYMVHFLISINMTYCL